MDTDSVVVNGVQLVEGMTLWRLKGLRMYDTTFTAQSPDTILAETARQLAENYADAVDNATAQEVKSNLREQPGYYDDTDLMNYHAMTVQEVNSGRESVPPSVSIKDLKEGRTHAFSSQHDVDKGGYMTLEPMAALEKHLGVTVVPVK